MPLPTPSAGAPTGTASPAASPTSATPAHAAAGNEPAPSRSAGTAGAPSASASASASVSASASRSALGASSASSASGGGGGAIGRLLGRPLFWVAALVVLFGVPVARTLLRRLPPPPPVLGAVPAFVMTDQRGMPFGTRELGGKTWVANFIFTSCQTVCPLLTQKMAVIGKRARHLGPDFHLVSFTVDPARDTPERLAPYAARAGADAHKWAFLTGALADVERAVVDGFKIGVDRRQTGADVWEIVHGEHLVLVDRWLRIRGYFDATPDGMDRLLEAAGRVINEGSPSDAASAAAAAAAAPVAVPTTAEGAAPANPAPPPGPRPPAP